jgi:hypothetical protein
MQKKVDFLDAGRLDGTGNTRLRGQRGRDSFPQGSFNLGT